MLVAIHCGYNLIQQQMCTFHWSYEEKEALTFYCLISVSISRSLRLWQNLSKSLKYLDDRTGFFANKLLVRWLSAPIKMKIKKTVTIDRFQYTSDYTTSKWRFINFLARLTSKFVSQLANSHSHENSTPLNR